MRQEAAAAAAARAAGTSDRSRRIRRIPMAATAADSPATRAAPLQSDSRTLSVMEGRRECRGPAADRGEERLRQLAGDYLRVRIPRLSRRALASVEGEGNGEPDEPDGRHEEQLPVAFDDPCPSVAPLELGNRRKGNGRAEEQAARGP